MSDTLWSPSPNRLFGRRVAICALTPPDPDPSGDGMDALRSSAILETEEAVISFMRAMLAEGATVTIVADEPLALLAGVVAGEYAEANVDITVVGEPRTATDAFAPLPLFIRRVASFRQAVDSAGGAHAVLLAGTFDRKDISLLRSRTPAGSLFAIAASGIDPWAADGHIRFLDDLVRREFSLVDRAGQDDEMEFEYPPVAFAAQWLVRYLVEEAEAEAAQGARSTTAASGAGFVSAEAAMQRVDWEDMVPRLIRVEQIALKATDSWQWRRQWRPPGHFVERAVADVTKGRLDLTGPDSIYRALAGRVRQLVFSGSEGHTGS